MKQFMRSLQPCSMCMIVWFTISGSIVAQTVAPLNGDMESWLSGSFSGTTYDSLEFWDSQLRLATALSIADTVVAKEEVIVNGGSYAVKLCSKLITSLPMINATRGTITTGKFTSILIGAQFGISGGAEIDCSPTNLIGYYQYYPVGNDSALIRSIMFSAAGDTIQDTTVFLIGETSTYAKWDIPLNYYGTETPVLAQVIIQSSGASAHHETTLYVDDVRYRGGDCFSGFLTPNSENFTNLKISPNPVVDILKLDMSIEKRGYQLVIFNAAGANVYSRKLESGLNLIDVSALNRGVHFIKITCEDSAEYRGQFVKSP